MNPRSLNAVSTDPGTAVLDRARALVPVLAARAAETERQRRNQDLSWGVDDLMRDHDGRSAQVKRIFEESRNLA